MGLYDILSYPFGLVLSVLYNLLNNDYALALIVFTLLAKLLLLPSSIKTQKNQAKTLRTRSKIEKIRKKYAGDQAKLNAELQAFYEKEGYGSMTAGCGTLLIQFPIIIGLYGAIYKPLSYIIRLDSATVKTLTDGLAELSVKTNGNSRMLEMNVLSHIDALEKALTEVPAEVFDQIRAFDFTAFGYDLGATPMDMGGKYMLVPIMSFAFSLISSLYSMIRSKKNSNDPSNNASMGCMFITLPFMSLWLAYQFPVGVGIYWALNSLLGFIQMVTLNYMYEPKKVISKMMVEETNQRRSKEKNTRENILLLKGKN